MDFTCPRLLEPIVLSGAYEVHGDSHRGQHAVHLPLHLQLSHVLRHDAILVAYDGKCLAFASITCRLVSVGVVYYHDQNGFMSSEVMAAVAGYFKSFPGIRGVKVADLRDCKNYKISSRLSDLLCVVEEERRGQLCPKTSSQIHQHQKFSQISE